MWNNYNVIRTLNSIKYFTNNIYNIKGKKLYSYKSQLEDNKERVKNLNKNSPARIIEIKV